MYSQLVHRGRGSARCQQGSPESSQRGRRSIPDFQERSFEKKPPPVNFHDKTKKQNLKTFAHIQRKHAAGDKAQGKQVVLKADRNLFGYRILVAQSRQLHQICSSSPPGTPTKATLAREQKVSPAAEAFPELSACIIDRMSLVQKLKGDGKTFA